MDIDTVIERLQELKAKGSTRVFLEDMTKEGYILDVITIEQDSAGDAIISGD